MDELVEKLFKKDYIRAKEDFIQEIELIRAHLLKCHDDVKIDCYDIEICDVTQKNQDANYLSDYNLKYIDNGISSLYIDSEMFDLIKDYIPKTITKLEMPLRCFMSNIYFFKMFPNLTTLVINDYKQLDKEDFAKILNDSNIREILCKNIVNYSRYYEQGDFVNASFPYSC